ncbi:hypothetical protein FKM82_009595 [Ascaphus truei]
MLWRLYKGERDFIPICVCICGIQFCFDKDMGSPFKNCKSRIDNARGLVVHWLQKNSEIPFSYIPGHVLYSILKLHHTWGDAKLQIRGFVGNLVVVYLGLGELGDNLVWAFSQDYEPHKHWIVFICIGWWYSHGVFEVPVIRV